MRLTAHHRRLLKATLLDTFQSLDDLSRLVANELNVNLPEIVVVHGQNLDQITEDLVLWADKRGRIVDLTAAATKHRPNHKALRDLSESFIYLVGPPPGPGEAPYRGLESYGVGDAEYFLAVRNWSDTSVPYTMSNHSSPSLAHLAVARHR